MAETLTIVEKTVFLLELDYFKNMESEQVARIAGRAEERRFPGGEWIFREEDPAEAAFLLIEGEVEITQGGRVLRRISPGSAFGLLEVAAAGRAFPYGAKTVGDIHALVISREDVLDAIRQYPDFAVGLLGSLAGVILQITGEVDQLKEENAALKSKIRSPLPAD